MCFYFSVENLIYSTLYSTFFPNSLKEAPGVKSYVNFVNIFLNKYITNLSENWMNKLKSLKYNIYTILHKKIK